MNGNERTEYHNIVVECYTAFVKDRPELEFSDEWWNAVIGDYQVVRNTYFGTPYYDFAEATAMNFLNQHERRQEKWRKTTH